MKKNIFSRVVVRVVHWIAWRFFYLIPIKSNRIIVSNFMGKGIGDSPQYIIEELIKINKDLEIIWIVNSEVEIDNESIKAVEYNTLKYIYYLSTSKVWLSNSRFYYFFKKKKEQKYIQTWHGFALKKIEKDVLHTLNPGYESIAIKDAVATDLMVSDSSFMSNIYRSSFWFNGEIAEIGLPRYDIIYKGSIHIKEAVFNYFKIKFSTKVILYAPTFRQNASTEAYSLDYRRIMNACNKRFQGDFIVLVRLHPNISYKSDIFKYSNKLIDASNYPNIQELLIASDIVITDYSSLVFDFALSSKPCFLYTADLESYRKERDFYFSLDTLPFDYALNNTELENNILEFSQIEYERKLNEFYKNVGFVKNPFSAKNCASIICSRFLQKS